MNALDWSLACLLGYSVLRGVWRGFLREALALAGVVGGFLLASWFSRDLAVQLRTVVHPQTLAVSVAFLLIFIATVVVAAVLGRLFQRTASAIGLGLVDRLLGLGFGLLRGMLLGLAFLFAIITFFPSAGWVKNSLLAPYFLQAAHAVSFVMPSEFRLRVYDGLRGLKHTSTY